MPVQKAFDASINEITGRIYEGKIFLFRSEELKATAGRKIGQIDYVPEILAASIFSWCGAESQHTNLR